MHHPLDDVVNLLHRVEAAEAEADRSVSQFLLDAQRTHGFWDEERYTATGFPRVFYLRYHGYSKFFPLWAIARYKNSISGQTIKLGM